MKIALAGGLGNQLFQISAALYHDSVNSIEFDTQLFMPDVTALSDLIDLNSLRISKKSRRLFMEAKMANLAIRSSRGIKSRNILDWSPAISRRIAKKALERFNEPFNFVLAKNIGFGELDWQDNPDNYLIGYFQSHIYANSLRLAGIVKLQERDLTVDFLELKKAIISDHPIIVHIRIGDYVKESKFGIVSRDYLLASISIVESLSDNIWVFSDEINKAKTLFDYQGSKKVHYINDSGMRTGEVFELMRYGVANVISNSTFSWWAAFLRIDQESPVCYPLNWFVSLPTPEKLFPEKWIGVEYKHSKGSQNG